MRYADKQFLTDSHGETGTMAIQISTTRVKDLCDWNVNNPHIEANVQLRDCHGEPIVLDFAASGEKQFFKRLDKLDNMIARLQKMRVQYHEMWYSHKRDLDFYVKTKEKK